MKTIKTLLMTQGFVLLVLGGLSAMEVEPHRPEPQFSGHCQSQEEFYRLGAGERFFALLGKDDPSPLMRELETLCGLLGVDVVRENIEARMLENCEFGRPLRLLKKKFPKRYKNLGDFFRKASEKADFLKNLGERTGEISGIKKRKSSKPKGRRKKRKLVKLKKSQRRIDSFFKKKKS